MSQLNRRRDAADLSGAALDRTSPTRRILSDMWAGGHPSESELSRR